mmetsp:Transcript_25321/g.53489  ORF Transcript_25321/g.53489 Transcript_25321/m.53489 type:complete len:153 (+) Transcript_25321:89-547(+)
MVSIEVPPEYGWVVLGAGVAPVITSMYLSGFVMEARKKFDVKYPNLYAVPKYHEKADEFNRVQRGHQNYLENATSYSIMTLLGGLKHPITCAVGSVFFCVGSVLYLKAYSDSGLDVHMARYKKYKGLAGIKWFGFLASLISSVKFGVSLIQS